ncbi:MAG: hypothetical protein IT381_06960 [Deltaproteobacteria bacterium]|nr:hypothetical protein [Deltaproteobacteria bacterium]
MNDPERLREIEEQRHHSELNARLPPKTTFKQVITAPAKAKPKKKPKKPVSDEKLRPTAQHPVQQMVGFGDDRDEVDELLEDGERQKIVVKA